MLILFNRNVFLGDSIRTTVLVDIPHIFRMLGNSLSLHLWIWGMVPLSYLVGYISPGGFFCFGVVKKVG